MAEVQQVISDSPGLEDEAVRPPLTDEETARATAAYEKESDPGFLFKEMGLTCDPIQVTSLSEWLEVYRKMRCTGTFDGGRLRKAAGRGDLEAVRGLVARGCDPRGCDGLGYTLLHACAAAGHLDCVSGVVEMLREKGNFDIDKKDKYGWTALVAAAANGHVKVVDRLCQLGANWKATTNHGRNALHWAATKGRTDVVSLLMKRSPDLSASDSVGMTPLHLAAQHGHASICKLLGGKNEKLRASRTILDIPPTEFQDDAFWHAALNPRKLSKVALP